MAMLALIARKVLSGIKGLAAWLRSTGTKVKAQREVTAAKGDMRGDLELAAYLSHGAQDLVLDLSFLPAAFAPHFHPRVTWCREQLRFFTPMPLLSVSPPSFGLLPICCIGPLSLLGAVPGWSRVFQV